MTEKIMQTPYPLCTKSFAWSSFTMFTYVRWKINKRSITLYILQFKNCRAIAKIQADTVWI